MGTRGSLLMGALLLGSIACSADERAAVDSRPQSEASVDRGAEAAVSSDLGAEVGTSADLGPELRVTDQAPAVADQGADRALPSELGAGGGNPARCAGAPLVALDNGRAVIEGDTTGRQDEFATLNCQGTTFSSDNMDGPQAYYRFQARKDQWYKLTLTAGFGAYVYLFSDGRCTESAIEKDCASGGATGVSSNLVLKDRPEAIYYQAHADGELRVAVDSSNFLDYGAFQLVIEEFFPPQNGSCAKAMELVFFKGVARARGDIAAAFTPDEFSTVGCGSSYTLYDGPQAYFRFQGKKGQAYKIKATSASGDTSSGFYLYLFGGTCSAAAINADCGSKGATGDLNTLSLGSTPERSLIFLAPADGPYTIALDSQDDRARGGVEVSVEPFDPLPNSTCAKAEAIMFSGGKASIAGDTLGLPNEYGSSIACGLSYSTFAGPQAYYELNVETGKFYTLKFKPTFSSYLYLFPKSACGSAAAINTACAGSSEGALFGAVTSGSQGTFMFKPSKPGPYLLAVDSTVSTSVGSFALELEEGVAPTNDLCDAPQPLVFTQGEAVVNGTTVAAANENGSSIKCGATTALSGPQLYYSFSAAAGKGYSIELRPSGASRYFYVFAQGSCGSVAGINTDCGSNGRDGLASGLISAGGSVSRHFRPRTPGTYLIAIDSAASTTAGGFELRVTEHDPPQNGSCTDAEAIVLDGGQPSTVAGSTAFGADEYRISCGAPSFFDGPQAYYSFEAQAGSSYWIELTTKFSGARLYLFAGACDAAGIEAACSGSAGDGGMVGPLSGRASFYFTPKSAGRYTLVVDSTLSARADEYGDFVLTLQQIGKAKNGSCAAAEQLTLSSGRVRVNGFTVGMADEFPGEIKCGGSGAQEAGQAYYQVALKAGVEYTLRAETDFAASIYLFADQGCNAAAINSGCVALGGLLDTRVGQTASKTFTPAAAGTYYIVVDGRLKTQHEGRFEFELSAYEPPTLVAPFSLDFETNDGALAKTGDWEWGQLAWTGAGATSCDRSNPPPNDQGHLPGNKGMWGTVLNGCHNHGLTRTPTNDTCQNDDPTLNSRLAFLVDLSQGSCASAKKATLSYWSYIAVYSLFDFGEVRINGKPDPLSQICDSAANSKKWEQKSLDLSAHLGKTVAVTFNFGTNLVYNDVGWYLDELQVLCQ